ncbi:MAG: agmatine deiminase family protein, partial [Bacteroidota bacterium]
ARFVNDTTVLLAEVPEEDLHDPIAQENHRRMEENFKILQQATDQDGNPLNIVRMPLPKLITTQMKPGDSVYDFISTLEYQDGSQFPGGQPVTVIAAASYLNFLITDKVIIGQKYWKEGMDEAIQARDNQVKSILEDLFPGRAVVLLDAMAINLGGGGIHCITMHEPKI